MFDIGWSELVVIAVVALIAIGPKELPGVLRMVGQWMGKIRRMAAEFQGQFQEAMREAEMADLKKHVDAITDATRDIGGFDPLEKTRKEIEGALEDKPAAGGSAAPSATPADTASAGTPDLAAAAAEPPMPIEPELPFAEPAPPVTSRDIAREAAPAPPAAAPDAGGRPA